MSSVIASHPEDHAARANGARRLRRARLLRRAVWGSAALALAAALALSFRPKPVGVQTVGARRGDLVVTVEEMAKTRVRDRFVVSAPTGGSLLRIELHPGDSVQASAPIAAILPTLPALLDPRSRAESQSRASAAAAAAKQAQAQVARASLAHEHATQELERTRALASGGSISPDQLRRAELDAQVRGQELASARFGAQTAAHEATMASAALRQFGDNRPEDRFDVTAPITGRVLRVIHESAGVVQPGTALLELGDPAQLEVVTDLLTADAVRVKPGARVNVIRWGGDPLAAHVRVVEPAGFTRLSALGVEEQRVSVIVDLDEPRAKWASLGDGFRVEVRIVVDERKDVVALPLGAVFRHESAWATYVVRDGTARLTPIGLGARSDADVEILSGIGAGDTVIVHPSERVADGVRVR